MIPQNLQVGLPAEIITEMPKANAFYAAIYVGDMMTGKQKLSPGYHLGGKLFPECLTLPYQVVPRCAITPLEKGMMSVSSNLIKPDERNRYLNSYRRNTYNPETKSYELQVIGGAKTPQEYLLFKELYPADELNNISHGGSEGVIITNALHNVDEVKEAQLHFFPNWLEIIKGKESLPVTLRELEDNLRDRLALVSSSDVLREVGAAYLESCQRFRDYGMSYIARQTEVIDLAKIKGVNARYDEIAERLFTMLEIQRQDSLVKDFAAMQNRAAQDNSDIKQAISLMAELVADKRREPAETSENSRLLEMMAQILANQNGVAQAQPAPKPVPETHEEYAASLQPSIVEEPLASDVQDFTEKEVDTAPKKGGKK